MAFEDFEPVIGLEVHVQLNTKTKLFCGCSAAFGAGDNENTCPVCTGMPGALPVLNRAVVDNAILAGLALNCEIRSNNVFSRKNYFYPDLPKGYQISQYDEPICVKGKLTFVVDGEERTVGITRIHMEEDAGKNTHHGEFSLVNLNRSSVPLLEVVSEPEVRNSKEAAEYMRTMRSIVQYLGICDGNLEEGSLRCDANVSVRKKGTTKFGTRVELKNINSFRFVEKAIDYEIGRQVDLVESGGKVIQETRLYDPDKNRTVSMRGKEEAHDYRYFPEPDLLTLTVDKTWIEKVKSRLPELPVARMSRFVREYQIPAYDAQILTSSRALAEYYETTARESGNPKASSNWIMVELLRELNDKKLEVEQSPIKPNQLAALIKMVDSGTISGKIGKQVFAEMIETSKNPDQIVKDKGLMQVSDTGAIEKVIDQLMGANATQVEQYRGGKEKVFGFFVGQVMKEMKGQANPAVVNDLLKKKLKG